MPKIAKHSLLSKSKNTWILAFMSSCLGIEWFIDWIASLTFFASIVMRISQSGFGSITVHDTYGAGSFTGFSMQTCCTILSMDFDTFHEDGTVLDVEAPQQTLQRGQCATLHGSAAACPNRISFLDSSSYLVVAACYYLGPLYQSYWLAEMVVVTCWIW